MRHSRIITVTQHTYLPTYLIARLHWALYTPLRRVSRTYARYDPYRLLKPFRLSSKWSRNLLFKSGSEEFGYT